MHSLVFIAIIKLHLEHLSLLRCGILFVTSNHITAIGMLPTCGVNFCHSMKKWKYFVNSIYSASSILYLVSRKFCKKSWKSNLHAQCRNYENLLSLFLGKKFRESNNFTKVVTKDLISRNIFLVRVICKEISKMKFSNS